jgi:hypothetical protein
MPSLSRCWETTSRPGVIASASRAKAVTSRAVGLGRTSSRQRRGEAAMAAPPRAKGRMLSAGISQSQSIPACRAHVRQTAKTIP